MVKIFLTTALFFLLCGTTFSQKVARSKSASPICDYTKFSYQAKSSVDATQPVSFNWSRAAVTGIANAPSSGLGQDIQENLSNTTNAPIVVDYIINMTLGNGCAHSDTLHVVVNPTPHLASPLVAQICDSSLAIYNPSSNVGGATFSWSRAAQMGIANAAGSGAGSISERLLDTAYTILSLPYFYQTMANSCVGQDTIQFSVIPRPFGKILITPTSAVYSGDLAKLLFVSTDTIPYKYIWSFGDGQTAITATNPVEHYYNTRQSGKLPIRVAITNNYGCVSNFLSAIQIIGDSTAAVVDTIAVKRHYTMVVFPVPFYTDLKLKYTLDGPSESAIYVVNDLAGRLVYAQPIQLQSGSYIINLPSTKMQSGIVYVVKIHSKTIQYEDKVYKK